MSGKTPKKSHKKIKNERKHSQAALDYLMSWGWILIIIVAVLIILFSFGIFRIPSAPTIISGFHGITMQAAQANSTMMVVKITNNYNQFVNITGITINVNGNTYTSYSCLNNIISTGQSTLCRVPVSIPTSSYLSKIQIAFTPYRSSIYEISNGTVSSTLVSGPIPINNQLTYFVERGLPYGSTFTVNYNTSTNSTTISSVKNNVSFNLPFGNYYFSVPSVTYQGCSSVPSPSSGTHSTGVGELIQFTSNCTTTFSETGLPSSQTWQVTYNGTTKSNSTNSKIYIHTNNTKSTQVFYTATAKSDTLSCVSYATPSIRLGGSYIFSAWNCTTTFSETGLPSSQQWHVSSYDSSSSSAVNTGSTASILQTDITTVSSYTASAVSNNIDCYSNPDITAEQGSSGNTFTTWTCITTFSETGLPSSQTWQATYNGTTTSNVATGTSIPITTNNVKNAQVSYTATAKSDTLSCVSYSTPSIALGTSYTFSAWNCITTFSETGIPIGATGSGISGTLGWSAYFPSGTKVNSSTSLSTLTYTQTDITTVQSYSAGAGTNGLDCGSSSTISTYQGGSVSFSSWDCTTSFSESGLPSGQNWYATYGSNTLPTESTGSSTSISQNDISSLSTSVAEGYSSDLSCNSYSKPSIYQGGSHQFAHWNCTTVFIDNGYTSAVQNMASQWTIKWDGNRGISSSTSLSFTNNDVTSVGSYAFETPFTEGGVLCTGKSGSAQMGTSNTLAQNWVCDTMIAGNEVLSEFLPSSSHILTLEHGSSKAYSGTAVDSVVYDPSNNLFYVALLGSPGEIMIFNNSNDAYVGTLVDNFLPTNTADEYPAYMVYANGYVYVMNVDDANESFFMGVISGVSDYSSTVQYHGDYLNVGGYGLIYNPVANTIWAASTDSSQNPAIYIFKADSSASYVNTLGNPFSGGSTWGSGHMMVYDPNNKQIFAGGSYEVIGGLHAEIADYWASNASCEDCTIDLSSSLGGNVVTEQYIPFRVKGVGHTDFIYATCLADCHADTRVSMMNLSNYASQSIFNTPNTELTSYYDGAYNSGFAFPWSFYYTLNCTIDTAGYCANYPTLYGTSAANPNSDNVSVTLDTNASAHMGGVITTPVTVRFASNYPSNTAWSVNFAGTSEGASSTAQNITFAVPSGNSYHYSIPETCIGTSVVAPSPSSGTASAGDIITVSWSGTGVPC